MMAESKGENRVSPPNNDKWGSKDWGIFQLNDHWQIHRVKDVNEFLNPETNVKLASDIYYERGNWGAWSTYHNGKYLEYLK